MRLKQGHVLHVNNVNENNFQQFQHYNNYNVLTNNFTGTNNTDTGNTGVYITGDTQTTYTEDTLQWCNTIDAIQVRIYMHLYSHFEGWRIFEGAEYSEGEELIL